ncbi:hypothetical protein DVS77_29990 [Mycolicibacterium moriokaense]|nr:hypothetical protein DVS77_29990 [Mycolicibacterium moriokaense]
MLCAVALAAGALAAASAAAPSGPSTASTVIADLQAHGFQVILNRTGAVPLDRCVVTSVHPGQTFARTDSGSPGAGTSIVTTVVAKTVYVDVDC